MNILPQENRSNQEDTGYLDPHIHIIQIYSLYLLWLLAMWEYHFLSFICKPLRGEQISVTSVGILYR